MERVIIPFTDEKTWLENRRNDLTSSDIANLFGYGYSSYEKMIYAKRNTLLHEEFKEDERIKWGKALQMAIANEFARQNSWQIICKSEYIRIPELRIGSSFDYSIEMKITLGGLSYPEIYPQLLEIKNVDYFQFKKEWVHGFETEATPYIELQVQHQLLVSGLEIAYLGVLVGGNQGICLRREANKKVHKAILAKVEKFWKDVGV